MWKLNRPVLIALFSVLFVLFFSIGVSANVIKPQLDIQTLGGDSGVSSTGGILGMDATAIAIITEGAPIDITYVDFALTAHPDSSPGDIYYGSLTVDSLLTADFTNLMLTDLGNVEGQYVVVFEADLSYTGGSLAGGLSNGRVEGTFFDDNPIDCSSDFTAAEITAKIGPIVPIPGVIWLLGSGLIAYVGYRKRKMI